MVIVNGGLGPTTDDMSAAAAAAASEQKLVMFLNGWISHGRDQRTGILGRTATQLAVASKFRDKSHLITR
ncbi:hypothetical protein O9993_10815 [Vibrio lentus]|nr:hypothetical protein [Vibrio lentus]